MKLMKHKEFNSSTIFSIFLFTPEILQCALLITTLRHLAIVSGKEFYNVGGESSLYIGFTAVLL